MRSATPSPSASRRWATTLGATVLLAALGAPAALASDCDLQVSHAPTGSQGDTAAVAITSQTLAAGVDGWERVGWQAAADTTITAVTLVREAGTEHRTDGDLAEGMAEDVSELRFCATTGDTEAPPADEAEVVQVTAVAAEEPAAAPVEEPAEEPADDPVVVEEPAATESDEAHAPADDEPRETEAPNEADEAPAPTDPNEELEPLGPEHVQWDGAIAAADADIEGATLAATVREPTAPMAGALVGAIIGLIVIAGTQRRRTEEERR